MHAIQYHQQHTQNEDDTHHINRICYDLTSPPSDTSPFHRQHRYRVIDRWWDHPFRFRLVLLHTFLHRRQCHITLHMNDGRDRESVSRSKLRHIHTSQVRAWTVSGTDTLELLLLPHCLPAKPHPHPHYVKIPLFPYLTSIRHTVLFLKKRSRSTVHLTKSPSTFGTSNWRNDAPPEIVNRTSRVELDEKSICCTLQRSRGAGIRWMIPFVFKSITAISPLSLPAKHYGMEDNQMYIVLRRIQR